ncbi:hypothetical protein L6164_006475 [Bauhinia variegata]|uniref:Uncharacterized protein n=1 Tax=Bauhinia variegata TaxID=167791 RepID=A0ACB9PX88_BAUVA|nr:hypothetical protein L6164_006475 [Bauhinia variegata]
MKPLLLPSSSLFLLSFVVFVSITAPCSLCADDEGFTSCNKTASCGNISNIKYPFWGLGRENYCSQSAILEVTCESDIPKLNISSVKYRILDWDQKNLRVARDDFWETFCPSDYKNSTFDVPMFKYIDGLQNLTLFYQCTNDFVRNYMLPLQSCPGTTTQFSYSAVTLNFSAFGYCNYVTVIPINGSQVQAVMSGQIQSAIRSGFGLEWVLENEECNRCSNSGGECGNYNGGFGCFCRDGLHLSSCSEGVGIVFESAFKLECSSEVAEITIRSESYRVLASSDYWKS